MTNDAHLRDVADAPVLALPVDREAQADRLVTGDKDVLILADRFAMLTPAEFCCQYMH